MLLFPFSKFFLISFKKIILKILISSKGTCNVYLNSYQLKNFLFFIKILKKSIFFQKTQLLEMLNTEISTFKKLNSLLQYKFNSHIYNSEFFLNYFQSIFVPQVSITSVFCSSLWLEREIYDMHGLVFIFHPDLRRLLTDYGFLGHPLRKYFPCVGYRELFYNYNFFKINWYTINL